MSSRVPTVVCNTGLGDFFVFSGAFVVLAERHGGLRIPSLPHNLRTIRACLVRHPEIEVFEIVDDDHMIADYRNRRDVIWAHWTRFDEVLADGNISWDCWAYRAMGVDFEERWNSCPIEAAAAQTPQIVFAGPYYLVHEDPERGLPVTYAPWHPVVITRRIGKYGRHTSLGWVDAIKRARELHFIDSSMWHLAESVTVPSEQHRYLHRYVRQWHPVWHMIKLRHHWRFIDGTPTKILTTK
jgi:hypothetical protein